MYGSLLMSWRNLPSTEFAVNHFSAFYSFRRFFIDIYNKKVDRAQDEYYSSDYAPSYLPRLPLSLTC